MDMLLDSYCYQTTNNLEKLREKKGLENTSFITNPILLAIHLYIEIITFLKNCTFNIKFDIDGTIRERLVIM